MERNLSILLCYYIGLAKNDCKESKTLAIHLIFSTNFGSLTLEIFSISRISNLKTKNGYFECSIASKMINLTILSQNDMESMPSWASILVFAILKKGLLRMSGTWLVRDFSYILKT